MFEIEEIEIMSHVTHGVKYRTYDVTITKHNLLQFFTGYGYIGIDFENYVVELTPDSDMIVVYELPSNRKFSLLNTVRNYMIRYNVLPRTEDVVLLKDFNIDVFNNITFRVVTSQKAEPSYRRLVNGYGFGVETIDIDPDCYNVVFEDGTPLATLTTEEFRELANKIKEVIDERTN